MTPEKLTEIANELQTQNNRITADPLFCVFEKERIFGIDPNYSDLFEWLDCSGDSVYAAGLTEDEAEERGFHKVHYIYRDRFVNAHFTEKAAKEHIKINGHNLESPFIYVTSLWCCEEMKAIRNALANQSLELAGQQDARNSA